MIGYRINPWLKICWTGLTPLVTTAIFIFMWVTFEPLTYNRTYNYPTWAQVLGMLLAVSSMICIPVGVIVKLYNTSGASLQQKWQTLTTPILLPKRIPPHWSDSEHLTLISQQYYASDELKMISFDAIDNSKREKLSDDL